MPIAIALQSTDFSRRRKKWNIEATLSTNYATGGDTLNFTTMTNPNFLGGAAVNSIPPFRDLTIKNCPDGYTAQYVPGTTLANSKIKFFATADTELAAGAYPANLKAVKLEIEVSAKMYSGM